MRPVRTRRMDARREAKAVGPFEDLPAEEQLERNRKLAALLREWENDPTGEGERFWPILKAELDRLD
jgi:hypothetical protein